MTVLLEYFLRDLMTKNGCNELLILPDNARLSTNQMASVPLPLTSSSNHSLARSSTHSLTRWSGDETSLASNADLSASESQSSTSVNTLLIAPTRKLSCEPIFRSYDRDPSILNSEQRGRSRSSSSPTTPLIWPTSSASIALIQSRQINPVLVARDMSPKRTKAKRRLDFEKSMNLGVIDFQKSTDQVSPSLPLSPMESLSTPSVSNFVDHFKRNGRSLSKTLNVDEDSAEAPRIPMRQLSTRREITSPVRPSSPFQKKTLDLVEKEAKKVKKDKKMKKFRQEKKDQKKSKKKSKKAKKKAKVDSDTFESPSRARSKIFASLLEPPLIPLLDSPVSKSYERPKNKVSRLQLDRTNHSKAVDRG